MTTVHPDGNTVHPERSRGTLELPTKPGSYRWYYLDVSSDEYSAVAIFMLGSLFSARYGERALPTQHAAVNFALYRHGRRIAWVLSEYADASLSADGRSLRIGHSSLERSEDGRVFARIDDRSPWSRRPVRAELVVQAAALHSEPVMLVDGLAHLWHPFGVRGRGEVFALSPGRQLVFSGPGYHDGNSGSRLLGSDLKRWSWTRTHTPTETRVLYRPEHGALPGWEVLATDSGTSVTRTAPERTVLLRTGWGLEVPSGGGQRLLESSPFYARFETARPGHHTLGEAADFARFRSPFVRWMADFRTRVAA
ncbi:MAG: carotenoid 1,2-hydratase [Archangium sp.]|nr:carotenoid 1,2-hydratase [Archangium sp.]